MGKEEEKKKYQEHQRKRQNRTLGDIVGICTELQSYDIKSGQMRVVRSARKMLEDVLEKTIK
jgi:hypothetical protein